MRARVIARALYGTFLLVAPHTAIRTVTGESDRRVAATVVRVLGVRHLLQSLTIERSESCGWLIVGIVLDIIHALSMVAVAIFKPNNRRLATLSVAVACGWTLNGLRAIKRN